MSISYFKGKDKLFKGRESKVHKSSYGSLDMAEIPEWAPKQQYTVGITIWVDITTTVVPSSSVTNRYVYMCTTQHYSGAFFDDTNWQLLSDDSNTSSWSGSGRMLKLKQAYDPATQIDFYNWEYAAGNKARLDLSTYTATPGALNGPCLQLWNWPLGAEGTIIIRNDPAVTPGVPFINNERVVPPTLFSANDLYTGGTYVPSGAGRIDKLTVTADFDGLELYFWDYGNHYRP